MLPAHIYYSGGGSTGFYIVRNVLYGVKPTFSKYSYMRYVCLKGFNAVSTFEAWRGIGALFRLVLAFTLSVTSQNYPKCIRVGKERNGEQTETRRDRVKLRDQLRQ